MARVRLLGRVPYADHLRILHKTACHLQLTYPFVLSWICVEAPAAACLVVGSRTAPVQEIIEHGRNGFLFDFSDAAALAAQMVEVLATRDGLDGVRLQARQGVVERCDLQAVCLPQVLGLLLAGRRAGRGRRPHTGGRAPCPGGLTK